MPITVTMFELGHIEVVAEARRGDVVLDLVKTTRSEVTLLDMEVPGIDGLTVARLLHQQFSTCRVLILTTFRCPTIL